MDEQRAILARLGLNATGSMTLVTHNSANSVAVAENVGVIKLYPPGTSVLVAAKEAPICRAARRLVPTPEVIGYGFDIVTDQPYIATTTIPGRLRPLLPGLTDAQRGDLPGHERHGPSGATHHNRIFYVLATA